MYRHFYDILEEPSKEVVIHTGLARLLFISLLLVLFFGAKVCPLSLFVPAQNNIEHCRNNTSVREY